MDYLKQLEVIRPELELLVLRFQDFSIPYWKPDPLDLRIVEEALILIRQYLKRGLTKAEEARTHHIMCNVRYRVRQRFDNDSDN